MKYKQEITFSDELSEFLKYIKGSKLMKLGIFFNILWISITFISYFVFSILNIVENTIFLDDFTVFRIAANLVRTDLIHLYTSPEYTLTFRYLPIFAYGYIWVSFLPISAGYIINDLIMLALNFLNTFLIYQLCKFFYPVNNVKKYQEFIFLFFMAPVQLINYFLGQISSLFIFLILLSLIFFENSKKKIYNWHYTNLYGGLFLGLAIVLKPFAILIVPYILVANFRIFLARFMGILTILAPNLLFFAVYPSLLQDFIAVNFQNTLDYHHSTSLNRFFISIANYWQIELNKTVLFLILFWIFFPISYVRFLLTPDHQKKLVHYYQECFLITMIVYIDSWFLYFVIWMSVLVPSIQQLNVKNKTQIESKTIKVLYKIPELCMLYFALGVVLYYTVGIDPIHPIMLTLFFILYQKILWGRLFIERKESI